MFIAGCSAAEHTLVSIVQVDSVAEMEALKTEYKENWQIEKESEEGWIKARRVQDKLVFEFARQLAEIGLIEKKLWQSWNDAVSRRYAIVERMAKLSK